MHIVSLCRSLPLWGSQIGCRHRQCWIMVCASWFLIGSTHRYPVVVVPCHQPACWKMSQPSICMALVVITGITAACFCLGWCSRQDGQVRISLLICSLMPGQNHLSLALWIDLSTPWWTRCSFWSKHSRIFWSTTILWLFTMIPSMTAISCL